MYGLWERLWTVSGWSWAPILLGAANYAKLPPSHRSCTSPKVGQCLPKTFSMRPPRKRPFFLGVKMAGVKLGTWAETEVRDSESCPPLNFLFPVVPEASCTQPSLALVTGTRKSPFEPALVMEILSSVTMLSATDHVQYNTLVVCTLQCRLLVQKQCHFLGKRDIRNKGIGKPCKTALDVELT